MGWDSEWHRGRNVLDRIGIGDFVELFGEPAFFGTTGRKPERYAGYVASINSSAIGISTTHPDNKNPTDMTRIEVPRVGLYRIIRKGSEPINFDELV